MKKIKKKIDEPKAALEWLKYPCGWYFKTMILMRVGRWVGHYRRERPAPIDLKFGVNWLVVESTLQTFHSKKT